MTAKPEHTLLLVDDEKSIIRALQRLFRREGYHILTADNGRDALELLKTCQKPVSMIISDQRMPGMSGTQFLRQAGELCPNAIRYLLTGYSDLDMVIQAANRGEIHRYLTKPWNDEDLLLQVRQSLHHFELIAENERLTELTIQQHKEISTLKKKLEQNVNPGTFKEGKDIASGHAIELQDLKAGMVLMEDLKHKDGRVLLNKGTILRPSAIESIQSMGALGLVSQKISICLPEEGLA